MRRRIPPFIIPFLIAAVMTQAAPCLSEDAAGKALFTVLDEAEKNAPTDRTIEKIEGFIRSYPLSSVTDEAIERVASMLVQKSDFREAAVYYQRLLMDFPASRYKIDALYGLGYCRYRLGDAREAKSSLDAVASNPDASVTQKVKARRILDTIRYAEAPGRARKTAIAAVLPLKGEYSAYGENTLRGILLAAGVFGKGTDMGVEIRVEDSGESERETEKTIERLGAEENVVAAVGPLLSSTATAAAREAQKRKLPVIVLSQKEGIPQTGDYVFRNFLTPKEQAMTVAEYAAKTLGIRKFAVLYPENSYGIELAGHFMAAVKDHGGLIVSEIKYQPGTKDFNSEIKTLFGIKVKEELVGRRRVTEYTPTVDVEALYIPDYYSTVIQIAPYLAYHNIKDVQLLGSNGWNSPELLKLAGDYVEGAVFVDGFFTASRRKGASLFRDMFVKAYGSPPGILEAEAYDSTMLILSALKGGAVDRGAVRAYLSDTGQFEGATGRMRFDPDGEAVKELFLLKVVKGAITEVENPGGQNTLPGATRSTPKTTPSIAPARQ
ncbi:MAG: penicillin-binding protein activator [Deltaproteobacteria bacterium]|nr:penicillin-binding protein activator [Deltaproteobacteria bacterium]